MKNTHGGVLILVTLQAEACSFTKINTPPWVFFTFFKLYKYYQIARRTTHDEVQIIVTKYWRVIIYEEVGCTRQQKDSRKLRNSEAIFSQGFPIDVNVKYT